MSGALARYSASSRSTRLAGSESSRATMSAVCCVRRAGLASSRSGMSSRSSSRRAIACAAAVPRRLSGRSRSEMPGSFQRASACRMRVSRFTRRASRRLLQQNAAVLLARPVSAQRLVGGRRQRLTGAQAEVRSMPRADDLTALHLRSGERLAVVRATVFYRVQLGAAAYDNHCHAVDLDREGCSFADGVCAPDVDPSGTQRETMGLKPPQNIRLPSNGIDFIIFVRRGSCITLAMIRSRSWRDL